MPKQSQHIIRYSDLTRKEKKALRNISATNTKSVSRAVVHTESSKLRQALTGLGGKHPNAVRIEFGKFLTRSYGMPEATAYNKLRYWHIEEWETIGFFKMIERFIIEEMQPQAPSATPVSNEKFPSTIGETRQWHASMPRGTKMKFYDYIAERGMCRERFKHIINGDTVISRLKQEGIGTAFKNYVESLSSATIANLSNSQFL